MLITDLKNTKKSISTVTTYHKALTKEENSRQFQELNPLFFTLYYRQVRKQKLARPLLTKLERKEQRKCFVFQK